MKTTKNMHKNTLYWEQLIFSSTKQNENKNKEETKQNKNKRKQTIIKPDHAHLL